MADEYYSTAIPIHEVLGVILAGGMGRRLYPLTRDRSKPSVPFGGNYRIIDFPISNCIYSGIEKVYVLTQYNSASLNRHITQTYKFDIFHRGFIDVLASEETPEVRGGKFYHGTAEAIRKAMKHLRVFRDAKYAMILAGDQLYKMDFRGLLMRQFKSKGDVTIGVIPVATDDACRYGIVKVEDDRRISKFIEKPESVSHIEDMEVPFGICGYDSTKTQYFASMNMYLFEIDLLEEVLNRYKKATDFGSHILPQLIRDYRVVAYIHEDYWEDIGTLRSYLNANLALTKPNPPFLLYHNNFPVFSKPRFLPPSRVEDCTVRDTVLGDGIVLESCRIESSVIGVRSHIREGTSIENSIVLGNDYYEDNWEEITDSMKHIPLLGIGKDCIIRNAIIDKNCHIGDGVRLINKHKLAHRRTRNYTIEDGIIVIPKDTILKNGTVI